MEKLRRKILEWFVILMVMTIVAIIGLFIYWLLIDGKIINKPLKFYSDTTKLETDKKVYHEGEYVAIKLSFCKYRNVVAIANWSLVDTIVRFYPEVTRSSPIGCYGIDKPFYVAIEPIPEAVPLGIYHIEGIVRVRINPLNEQVYNYKSLNFEVK